jgi:hypothetical protein
LDRRLGGLQSSSGRSGEEKNSQPQPGIDKNKGELNPKKETGTVQRINLNEKQEFNGKYSPGILIVDGEDPVDSESG